MRRSRRTAVYAVVTGLLTAGTLTAIMPTANANVAGSCNGSGTAANCILSASVTAPTAVTIDVHATVNGEATVAWTVSCTLRDTTLYTTGAKRSETPAQVSLTPLPATAAGQCTVSASVRLPTDDSTNALTVALTYTPAASPSPSPSATFAGYQWQGYDSNCLADAGNSSALRARVQIWTCGADLDVTAWPGEGATYASRTFH